MKKSRKLLVLLLLVILNAWLFFVLKNLNSEELKIYFFDVGQGDSIFIETKEKKQILIDGGPDNKVIQNLSQAMPFWDHSLDLVILTHPEQDHLAGLIEVLKRYKVKGIIESGVNCGKPDCLAWEKYKEEEGAAILNLKLGDSVNLDENTKIVILHPFENLTGREFSKLNNTSLVAKIVYGSQNILLTGDIEEQIERKLALGGINLDSDYLKIPHHGSKTSTSEEFLDKVSPSLAFISLGLNNRYGHPHQEVTERLEKRNIKYYRTDELGTILLSCRINESCRVKSK